MGSGFIYFFFNINMTRLHKCSEADKYNIKKACFPYILTTIIGDQAYSIDAGRWRSMSLLL